MMYSSATTHSVTDRQTDGRRDDSVMPIADHTVEKRATQP